jgi:hypothetical protein
MWPDMKTKEEGRGVEHLGRQHLGRRRFNTLGYQVRKLEQRVRALEAQVANTNRPENGSRSEEESPNVRGSRS